MGLIKSALNSPWDREHRVRSWNYKIVRVVYYSVRGFFRDECFLKASELTFFSLTAFVPMLAIVLSIATAFGFGHILEADILKLFSEQTSAITAAVEFAHAFVREIKGETLVGFGVCVLFLSVFALLEVLEQTINQIWNVKKLRGLVQRFINYIVAIIVFPIIFVLSMSVTIAINDSINHTMQTPGYFNQISKAIHLILEVVPYLLMCCVFIYIYVVVPKARLYLWPRLLAGILAGVAFQIWQVVYLEFQLYVTSYNAIYGSLAALPLFIIWVQVSFVILLLGAEFAAHLEADRFFKKTSKTDSFRWVAKKQLILAVLVEMTAHFLAGKGPYSIDGLIHRLGISAFDAREALFRLRLGGIIAEISNGSSEKYQLVINPESVTLQTIWSMIDLTEPLRMAKVTKPLVAVSSCIERFEQAECAAGGNTTLKDFCKDQAQ